MPFQIVRNDITNMQVDAIVNSANPKAVIGSGVDSAIYRKAGLARLFIKRRQIGEILPGECAVTPAFDLPAKVIIHTVGPVWVDGNSGEKELLYRCYENVLMAAKKEKCKSIAFPLISSGNYGFPKSEAIQIAMNAVSSFLVKHDMMVYLVVYDKRALELSEKLFQDIESYIDEHYIDAEKKRMQEFWDAEDQCMLEERYILHECNMSRIRLDRRNTPENAASSPIPSASIPQAQSYAAPKSASRKPASRKKRSLEDVMVQLGETFQERLLRLVDEKKMSDVEVYKKANIDRKLYSKIRCNVNYKPKKKTALALAIALELNLDETKDLLGRAELALSPSSKFDLIISYFIQNQVYDIYTINMALFNYDQPILGD